MKNKYSPISDSDDSSKTLNDEKADSRSSPSDGTPPPYTASNKFVDLEMAPETEESSKKKRYLTPRELAIVFAIFIVYNVCLIIARVILLVYEIPFNQLAVWVLFGVWCALFLSLTIVITQMPKEWFTQAGRATKKVLKKSGRATKKVLKKSGRATKKFLKKSGRATKKVAPAVCKALIILISLNGVGGYVLKLSGGFEYIHSAAMLVVLAVLNICFFVLLIHNPDAIEDHVPTRLNRISRNGPPRNEEIELQPLAEQSANV
ncbi:wtf meiotic driver [Schizosaccharomyces osmophilus]|uniref:Wtf meiotic driver n=1 Tax=Schizosaccharomyces osmophilus TaxID=2545709 RepID=A0AAE9W682_9SCHI|nr:wtf meiotic driver [Schizosaccharomyces osmophilus]WBW70837.1 wtf meiotic driver [Schizosaccharomyces osmophilus]